jgi:2-hydroxy-6-oxonona-2,4-dienedioate hydrolase
LQQIKGKIYSIRTPVAAHEIHSYASRRGGGVKKIPVVLVHGLCISNRYMLPAIEELGKYCDVYAPDLPGSGKSRKPPKALGIEQLSNVLAEWMKANNIERAVLVGHSFGCQVVADFALRHPQMLERAVLAAPTLNRRERTFLRQLLRFLQDAFYEPFSLMYIAIFDYLNFGFFRAIATIRFAFADRIEEKLPRIKAPALVIRGEYDTVVPPDWSQEVTGLLPDGKLVTILEETHGVNFNSPRQFAKAIRLFAGY